MVVERALDPALKGLSRTRTCTTVRIGQCGCRGDPLTLQFECLYGEARRKESPLVRGRDGTRSLALAVLESIETSRS